MHTFGYQTVDAQGHARQFTIRAESLQHAAEQLRAQEVNVVSLWADDAPTVSTHYEPRDQRPPPAPRELPAGVTGAAGAKVLAWVGGIFTAIASIIIVIGLGLLVAGESAGFYVVLIPMIHLIIGVGLLVFVVRRRRYRHRLYQHGVDAMAVVQGVGFNRRVRINGTHPYELAWSFDIDGHTFHDTRSTMNDAILTLGVGDRIWVLYDPEDPEESVEWPPL